MKLTLTSQQHKDRAIEYLKALDISNPMLLVVTEANMPTIEINCCSKCPNVDISRFYTSDSFEMVFEWRCKKGPGTRIGLDWCNESRSPAVPEWCPLDNEQQKDRA